MKLDWKYLKSNILFGTAAAIGISALISLTTTIPVWISLGVLLFNWPITAIIIESIASRNPDANKRITVRSWWSPVITLIIISVVTLIVYFAVNVRFWTAFGYCTLNLTFA